ncbi:MAG: hypothetical protein KFF73_19425, partial [Cyclobacteriaceae bacterium]|nr:hypothetical protein [Cyclobacteriaceae bacterium]
INRSTVESPIVRPRPLDPPPLSDHLPWSDHPPSSDYVPYDPLLNRLTSSVDDLLFCLTFLLNFLFFG